MDLPVEDWYRAVFIRRSRRTFIDKPVPADELDRLAERFAAFRPFPGARAVVVPRPPAEVLRGAIGSYGRIVGAPAWAAFIGDGENPAAAAAVGYLGEALILEATARGLATCWVSGFFRPEAVRTRIETAPVERIYAVTPIGFAADEYSGRDRIYRALARSHSRKPLSALIEAAGSSGEPWQEQAFEAARLAPSAGNRQPWRFAAGPGTVEVRMAGSGDGERFPKRLDCGIAMLHLELGARAAGKSGAWTWLEAPGVARFEINV
jgi:nitroreductase